MGATMLHLIPAWLPNFDDLVVDIGRPHPSSIAKSLGVTERTVYRWLSDPQSAPRPAIISLFWLSRWGLSRLDAELFNRSQVYWGHAQALKRENAALEAALLDHDTPQESPPPPFNVVFPKRFHG